MFSYEKGWARTLQRRYEFTSRTPGLQLHLLTKIPVMCPQFKESVNYMGHKCENANCNYVKDNNKYK